MKPKILLVNPPIYDFAAYDFWQRPYGLLETAGVLRGKVDFSLFDYLDEGKLKSDKWGKGRFAEKRISAPPPIRNIPRYFRRYGAARRSFKDFLACSAAFDFALMQTAMTYWYPGVVEVIEDIRKIQPQTKIILGGNYATICPEHAKSLGADLIIRGAEVQPLWDLLGIEPDSNQPAMWEAYSELKTGAIKLSDGCPFNCSYCSVPKVYGGFKARPLKKTLAELELMLKLDAENIAFYDDALLYKSDDVLVPFLNEVIKRGINVNFHTPNALNARLLTDELARLMVRAGFKTFYIGLESASEQWQKQTGSKVSSSEFAAAVKNLKSAGANPDDITAYQILGHPKMDIQQLEESMRFVRSLGVRGMLADFSPIPGTPDGDACSQWVDMSEPLMHNKTAFTIIRVGFDEANRLKDLQRKLNRSLKSQNSKNG
jgi:sulfatase maturation enzyme AslB (radical SAM superfamily)